VTVTSEQEKAYSKYKQEYTLLPTQKIFTLERMTQYERDELLKKWELDKLLQERQKASQEALTPDANSNHQQNNPADDPLTMINSGADLNSDD